MGPPGPNARPLANSGPIESANGHGHEPGKTGGPGVDGIPVEELPGHLREHWPVIRGKLLSGAYRPQPVRRVYIPKPGGGKRKLGIPTVLDLFVQQAVAQVMRQDWERTFSEHSYGFRPRRSAHQALAATQQQMAAGRCWVVDLDLEKFLDLPPPAVGSSVSEALGVETASPDPARQSTSMSSATGTRSCTLLEVDPRPAGPI